MDEKRDWQIKNTYIRGTDFTRKTHTSQNDYLNVNDFNIENEFLLKIDQTFKVLGLGPGVWQKNKSKDALTRNKISMV